MGTGADVQAVVGAAAGAAADNWAAEGVAAGMAADNRAARGAVNPTSPGAWAGPPKWAPTGPQNS